MASCPPRNDQAGYATPMALVLSLAFALVGSAMAVRGLHTLRLAKAELERTRQELTLDGAHLAAAAAVIRSGGSGPYRWTFSTDLGLAEALAEPEAAKLGLANAEALDDDLLQVLGVSDSASLRSRLAVAAEAEGLVDLGALDTAPAWRACAASLVSRFGAADQVNYVRHQAPEAGQKPAAWHIGEAWRIRVATQAGWRDDRIVRFTGDARRPAATVSRRLSKSTGGGGQCEQILADDAGQ